MADDAQDAHRALGIDPETGFGMTGDYPTNLRLRAEALSAAGLHEDPDGIVTADDIKAAGDRVAAETPSAEWKKDELVDHATAAGIEVPPGATKADVLDLIHTAPDAEPGA